VDKGLGRRLVAVKPAVGADPQPPLAVGQQHPHPVIGQRARVADRGAVVGEAVAVEARQAVLGAEPHEAVGVLRDRQHRLLRQAILHRQVFEAQRRRRRGGPHRAARQAGQRQQQCE
jgi:hypothetical protein